MKCVTATPRHQPMAMVKLTRTIYVDLNLTFNLAYIVCRFELHEYMKLMCDFKQNAALRNIIQKV